MNHWVKTLRTGLLVTPLLLAACAITDVTTSGTPPPPMTLSAPPNLNFTGTCDQTRNLEDWLQVTTQLVSDFQTKMNDTAGKNRGDAYQPTLQLVAMRDSAYGVATPDCAANIEVTLSNTMKQAVDTLQSFVNGSITDISGAIAQANTQFDQITAQQNALIQRLQTQIQNQIKPTATS